LDFNSKAANVYRFALIWLPLAEVKNALVEITRYAASLQTASRPLRRLH
jgi:hypothetical protein